MDINHTLETIAKISPNISGNMILVTCVVSGITAATTLYLAVTVFSGANGGLVAYLRPKNGPKRTRREVARCWISIGLVLPAMTAVYFILLGFFLDLFETSAVAAFANNETVQASVALYTSALKGILAYLFMAFYIWKASDAVLRWEPER